jgi:sulfate permease, SulP family
MYLGARALGLGVLATFLSRPILVGFFAGISLSILVGQIGRMTGIKIESDGLISPILELAGKIASVHWPSLLLSVAMFAVLQLSSALRLLVPGPVVVVALSVLLSAALDFQGLGIAVVGDIPSVLPSLSLPLSSGLPVDRLLLGAAAVFLVSFAAGIVTARSFGARGGYPVDADREMVGFGAANIGAGLFGAFPVTASDSRTAINASVGGRSQLAAVVAAVSLLAIVLYLRPALAILPIPALGAILVSAALSLIDVEALRQLWRISRMEFAFALIALWGAASFGVLNGVVIAIGATFAYLLHQMMYPRDALLGRVAGRDGFYKLHRTIGAEPIAGMAIYLIQGSRLFFNADHVKARLDATANALPGGTRWLVLDASAVVQVDSTAAAMLEEVRADLAARGIALGLAELHADVRGLLERSGLIAAIGPRMDLDDALRAFERLKPQLNGGSDEQAGQEGQATEKGQERKE